MAFTKTAGMILESTFKNLDIKLPVNSYSVTIKFDTINIATDAIKDFESKLVVQMSNKQTRDTKRPINVKDSIEVEDKSVTSYTIKLDDEFDEPDGRLLANFIEVTQTLAKSLNVPILSINYSFGIKQGTEKKNKKKDETGLQSFANEM